ncbi:MAG TPA: type 2 lanthipeptide synthetase LanM family protein [Pseudobacteroides sp.]|uniref:type 2 lanthipeptide synthetase LanM family protein n=1 Tax=Pseudobacteroides sp. TaxID=1968840 RepID=UPI002F950B53
MTDYKSNTAETYLQEVYNITFDDVIDFWMTLFPEIKKPSDLIKILKDYSGTDFKELKKEYHTPHQNDLSSMFSFLENLDHSDSYFNAIFSRAAKTYKWVWFFRPIIRYHINDFYLYITESDFIVNKDEFLFEIICTILGNLNDMSYRVLILETNIARMDNRLLGENSTQKAEYFANTLLKDESYLRSLYDEYNELTRLMKIKVENTCKYLKDIIRNTKNEYNNLSDCFSEGKGLGKIRSIVLGTGDTHNDGKSVACITFDSGVRLAYKPRALDLEYKYLSFIDWINQQDIHCFYKLKSPKVHYIDSAGWMEFIDHTYCQSPNDIARFYSRIGQLLCLLYLFNAKDFHYENLIAHGDQPVLIDLETLFHPEILNINMESSDASTVAMRIINSSVKGIALLPTQIVNQKNNKVLEIGGLSNENEQVAPFKSIFIKDIDTDEIKVEAGYGYIHSKDNSPIIDGNNVKSEQYIKEIKDGFIYTYKWIQENKDLFKATVNDMFEGCLCRILYRPTNIYMQLLSTSYHPDLLRNPIDRKVYLHRIGLVTDEDKKDIAVSELSQMLNGDVPYFSVYLEKDKVLDGSKKEVASLPMGSTLGTVTGKIEGLSDHDFNRQLALINCSYNYKSETDGRSETKIRFQESVECIEMHNVLIRTAKTIGDFILEKSIAGKKNGQIDRTWIGLMEIIKDYYEITNVGNDIYSGNCGIALFLAHLGAITGEEKYTAAAFETITSVINYIEDIKDIKKEKIGFFCGISGWLYSIFHIGKISNKKDLINYVYNKIYIIKELLALDQHYDIISGLSGSMGAILSIYEKSEGSHVKNLLVDICVNIYKLIKEKIVVFEENRGITWGEEGFVGFSHGNAGVDSQLIRLYSIINDDDLLGVLKSSLCYERSMFDEKYNNWRKQLNKEGYSNAWCHGAPGILLSRLMLIKYGYTDDMIMKEIDLAIKTVKENSFGNDFCLCHGDLGNLRVLNYAAYILDDTSLKASCLSTLQKFISEYFNNRWNGGGFYETENSSLMTGLAGLGYGILQFYKPGFLPEVLCIE